MDLTPRADTTSAISDFKYYYYEPAMSAAVIFTLLFGVSTAYHIVAMSRSRTWFMVPFIVGCCFETTGYIGRCLSASENPGPYQLGPYIIQAIFLLVAPALFAASVYMQLGRIVHMIDADRALFIRRTWLTKIFVCGDVLSFLMQSSGGGLLATGNIATVNAGNNIIVAGLFLQIIFFGLFVIAAAIFQLRLRRMPTQKSYQLPWYKKHMLSIYLVSAMIFVRSIVRVVEYLQGFSGYIITHEVYLYVFDALVMWAATVVMAYIHPGEVAAELRRSEKSGESAGHMDHGEGGYILQSSRS